MKYGVLALAMLLAATSSWAKDGDDKATRIAARLASTNEVPAVSSPASGVFRATIDETARVIEYELSFDGLQANVVMSHIHFAQKNVNGAIMVWLCGTAANPGPTAPPTQLCPQSGTISGVITPANILAIGSQGIAAGEFEELVAVLRKGLAYVNVHTVQSPGGEIRGQIKGRD